MSLWHETMSDIEAIIRDAGGKDKLTIDQRIAIAQAHAMLAVSQDLSAINPQNSGWRDDGGKIRNGWGLLTGTEELNPGGSI